MDVKHQILTILLKEWKVEMTKLLPEPHYYGQSNVDREYCATDEYPYTYNVNDMLDKMGVKVPFNVINRDMGISTCPNCGSKYAGGWQVKCQHIGYFYYSGGWGSNTRYKTKKEYHENHRYSDSSKEEWTECRHNLIWDMQDEWKVQSEFFSDMTNLYNQLNEYAPETFTVAHKYANNLPMGMPEALEKRALMSKIHSLEMQVSMHQEVLKEIADRMQHAGGALLNGVNF